MPEGGIGVRGVRAVMIFSADPDASSAWWAELLGLPVKVDGDFRWIDVPGEVELAFHPADEVKNPSGASTIVYWHVDSFRDALDRVLAAGGALHRGPLDAGSGRQIAQVRDPFGAVFGLDGP